MKINIEKDGLKIQAEGTEEQIKDLLDKVFNKPKELTVKFVPEKAPEPYIWPTLPNWPSPYIFPDYPGRPEYPRWLPTFAPTITYSDNATGLLVKTETNIKC